MELKYYITLHQQSRLDETIAMAALERQKFWSLARGSMEAGRRNLDIVARWMERNGTFHWVPPAGGFLSFPQYDLDLPSWDLCIRLIKEPYRTYIIPGSCYGYEHHVRLGFGPDTSCEDVEDGLAQISRFVQDVRSGRVEVEISGN
jgi:aspartate/methionine/tyrosine aminotransferase